ncbi:unnamed protein product [Bursaphelenchus xylophilus]|uniref:(pine wood nematode) hypothetical protein n=1 Tax=Bursaphelenchus xylophilus TaxID=6326 RepID=A0A1I7S5H3_BURXY|nr:unnamed protein product [Bursaphelenchus xylophilus]CAG9124709.1 unnamed protein product [Bursaphelenchus xylophilus]
MEQIDPYNPAVFPGIFLTIGLGIVGIFGNANIVWASVRNRRLRSTCNTIIAVTALSDIFHQAAHLVFAYCYLSGNPFLSIETAFYIFLIPAFNMCFGAFLVLSIGIDRLFCVSFPSLYSRVESNMYLVLTMIPPAVYSIIILYQCYIQVEKFKERLIIAMIAEIFVGDSHYYCNVSQAIVYLLSIIVYTSLWIVVRKKSAEVSTKKLVKSLSFIMLSLLVGWLFVGVFTTVYGRTHPNISHADSYFFHMNIGWLINLGISANYFIYFAFNDEYRRAFSGQLRILTCGRWVAQRSGSVGATFVTSHTPTF